MERIQTRIHKLVKYIRSIDKEYIKHKYHQLRNLKKEDVIHFVKRHRKLIQYSIIAGFAVLIIIPIATYIYFGQDLSSKERILNRKNAGVILLDRNEKPFFTLFDATTRNPVTIDQIPEHTAQAFVAVEDKDFYNHPGFSIPGFARAIRENILSESFAQGGSTISQQLIKNAILSLDKKLLRKYQELVLAVELERRYSKADILEMYLNTIYFGEGAFGIQDASQRYFSKDAAELTLGESALLAAVIRAPSALSPISGDLKAALERKDLILQLMAEQGYITEAEKTAAQKQKITIDPTTADINEEAVHFALMIQDALIEEYGEQTVANSG
ncbi:MAG: transglycosylase domain-containing protein, partial [Weeksellaceae bacterium]